MHFTSSGRSCIGLLSSTKSPAPSVALCCLSSAVYSRFWKYVQSSLFLSYSELSIPAVLLLPSCPEVHHPPKHQVSFICLWQEYVLTPVFSKLYTLVNSNYDNLHRAVLDNLTALVQARSWKDSSAMSYLPPDRQDSLDGVVVFEVIYGVFYERVSAPKFMGTT